MRKWQGWRRNLGMRPTYTMQKRHVLPHPLRHPRQLLPLRWKKPAANMSKRPNGSRLLRHRPQNHSRSHYLPRKQPFHPQRSHKKLFLPFPPLFQSPNHNANAPPEAKLLPWLEIKQKPYGILPIDPVGLKKVAGYYGNAWTAIWRDPPPVP